LGSASREGRVGGRHPKLTTQQQNEIVSRVSLGQKTGAYADAARKEERKSILFARVKMLPMLAASQWKIRKSYFQQKVMNKPNLLQRDLKLSLLIF
jgi:hypothetical protein